MSERFFHSRNLYERHLYPWIDKPVIKIITGMRRVGKSCLLRQLYETLRSRRVEEKRIHFIDKESVDFDGIRNYKDLAACLKERTADAKGRQYLLIDEVQEIEQWEKTVNSCFKSGNWDIYLTGSNAHMLSSELATFLSGRYVEIPVFSLSLPEFLQFNGCEKEDAPQVFARYLRYGGFPALHQFSENEDTIYQYINSLYDTIILKDIVNRHDIRNVPLFQNISRFVFDNIGNTFSAKKVADYLKSQRLNITVDTVQKYLGFLTETYALHRVSRYDIKGKRNLEINEKYYLGDIGLRNAVLGYRESAINGLLENLVFLELKRKGYQVAIGKMGTAEIDFIATRNKEKQYIQVCYLLASEETIAREFGTLASLPDNYPKKVLSMDPLGPENREGIQWQNVIDYLMHEDKDRSVH
jgi:predicted AAA+ superfamily ATPase